MADNVLNAATAHEPSQKIPGQRPGSWAYYSGGYCYHINKTTNDKRYLICARSRCRAKAWMRLEENAPIFQSGMFEHAHLPDYEKAPKMQFLHNLKKRSREEADRSVKSILMDESLRNQETAVKLNQFNTTRAMKTARLTRQRPGSETSTTGKRSTARGRPLSRSKHPASNLGNASAVGGDEVEEQELQPLTWDELMGVDVISEEEEAKAVKQLKKRGNEFNTKELLKSTTQTKKKSFKRSLFAKSDDDVVCESDDEASLADNSDDEVVPKKMYLNLKKKHEDLKRKEEDRYKSLSSKYRKVKDQLEKVTELNIILQTKLLKPTTLTKSETNIDVSDQTPKIRASNGESIILSTRTTSPKGSSSPHTPPSTPEMNLTKVTQMEVSFTVAPSDTIPQDKLILAKNVKSGKAGDSQFRTKIQRPQRFRAESNADSSQNG